MDADEIGNHNPWWLEPSAIQGDSHVKEFLSSDIRWYPAVRDDLDVSGDRVYTLRGPRQVGKTTLLKLMVRKALEEEGDPRRVLYLTCDQVRDDRELVDTFNEYLELSGRVGEQDRRLVLLDEISSVDEWWRGVKVLADTGRLERCTLVLTGSHSLDIKRSSERLPGRRGEGASPVNLVLLPASFREHVAAVDPDLHADVMSEMDGVEPKDVLMALLSGELPATVKGGLRLHSASLRRHLGTYMLTGGLMRPTRELVETGSVHPGAYEIYVRSLLGDLARWGFRETIARQVVGAVLDRMTTRVSLNSIAQATELGSHNTVSRYLEALEDSFLLLTVHQLELHRRRATLRGQRKVYVSDPFLLHAVRGWTKGRTDYLELSRELLGRGEGRGMMAEALVASHLARLVRQLHPSDLSGTMERLYFWRKKGTDREVDLVLRRGEELLPVEVKHTSTVSRRDLVPIRALGGGLVVTRDVLEQRGNVALVPLDLFLWLV